MNTEQYIGCIVLWNNRLATIVGCTDRYEGTSFILQYLDDESSSFSVNVFDEEILQKLPDPANGFLKYKDNRVWYQYKETEYELTDQPYEPCLYIKKDEKILHALHNAFSTEDLPQRFAQGEILHGIDGKDYDYETFCKVLAKTIESQRSDMDFPYAARL